MTTPDDIAKMFLAAYAGKYAAADAKGLSDFYGEDSIVSFDGQSVRGRTAIASALAPRVAGGGVTMKWITVDAQPGPGGCILIAVTGESSIPAGKFAQLLTLFPIPGSGGMYVRNDVVRFGPGAAAFASSLDTTGLGASFAQQYYSIAGGASRAQLGAVYRPTSVLTFEGRPAAGVAAIMESVSRAPSGKQEIITLDVQPVAAGAVAILVSGRITLEGEANALNFAQAFAVVNDPASGGPYVANEFFRFNM